MKKLNIWDVRTFYERVFKKQESLPAVPVEVMKTSSHNGRPAEDTMAQPQYKLRVIQRVITQALRSRRNNMKLRHYYYCLKLIILKINIVF